jgi:peptidoglycan/xylan/chitin deacetylase (PgdA/CDA1 family)
MPPVKSFILTYHSLDHSGAVISLPPHTFRQQMEILHKSQRRIVPLDQIRDKPGSVALTFDDGYQNFHEFALPVLAERNFPATVFITTGHVGGEARWEGQIPSARALRLMSRSELQEASEYGVRLGAHGANHRDLTKLSDEQVIAELEASRDALETQSGEAPKWFAYPFGACDERVRTLAASRFDLACGAQFRYTGRDADPFELPRLDIYYFRDIDKFQALVEGRANAYVAIRRGLRQIRSRLFR